MRTHLCFSILPRIQVWILNRAQLRSLKFDCVGGVYILARHQDKIRPKDVRYEYLCVQPMCLFTYVLAHTLSEGKLNKRSKHL